MKLLQLFKNKRIRLAVLIVFLLVNGVTALSYYHKSNQWRITMDSAMSALEARSYEKAEIRFLSALKSLPKEEKGPKQWLGYAGLQQTIFMQGMVAFYNQNFEKSQELFLKALAIHRDILTQFPYKAYSMSYPSPQPAIPDAIYHRLVTNALIQERFEEAEYYLRSSIAFEEMKPGFDFGKEEPRRLNHELLQQELGDVLVKQKDVGGLKFLVEQCKKWNYTYALESLEPKLAELKNQL